MSILNDNPEELGTFADLENFDEIYRENKSPEEKEEPIEERKSGRQKSSYKTAALSSTSEPKLIVRSSLPVSQFDILKLYSIVSRTSVSAIIRELVLSRTKELSKKLSKADWDLYNKYFKDNK